MNRFFFNEPHGTVRFVIETPWSGANLQVGTHWSPGGLMPSLWIVQYANPPATHYWTCRCNGTLGVGNTRFEFAAKATGSETVAFHTMQPTRAGLSAVACRWTSATEGELDLSANTMDIFVGNLTTPMTKGTAAQLGVRPTPIVTGGRVQWNTLGGRVSEIDSTAEVLPDVELIAWWDELRLALQ